METTNIVIILLFVIPGILAKIISETINDPIKITKSTSRDMINSILFSIPIVLFSSLTYILIFNIQTITSFANSFENVFYIINFILLILAFTLIIGLLHGYFKYKLNDCINELRMKKGAFARDDISCWRKFFNFKQDEGDNRNYIKIEKNGVELCKGYLDSFSIGDESESITLRHFNHLNVVKGYDEDLFFNKVNYEYIDIEKGIVIKKYQMDDYIKWFNANKKFFDANKKDRDRTLNVSNKNLTKKNKKDIKKDTKKKI